MTAGDEATTHLRVRPNQDTVDAAAAERAISDLLLALGRDPEEADLVDTPRRVARAYVDLLTPRPFRLTTFANEEGYDELILARQIPFHSLCEHHLLPFYGLAFVGYLPDQQILGLSKLARVVELFARRLQVQERLTQQVANWLRSNLDPKGVAVVLQAEHMCMSLRGVEAHGASTVTSALHGALREDPRSRQEFFTVAGIHA